jgi:hypothetical protein
MPGLAANTLSRFSTPQLCLEMPYGTPSVLFVTVLIHAHGSTLVQMAQALRQCQRQCRQHTLRKFVVITVLSRPISTVVGERAGSLLSALLSVRI